MAAPSINATLTLFSSTLCETIVERLSFDNQFTTVTTNAVKDIAPVAVALLSLDPYDFGEEINVTHIGIIRKGRPVATGQIRLKVTDLFEFPTKISIDNLVSNMPKRFQELGKKSFTIDYKKVSPKTGVELFKALVKSYPDNEMFFQHLHDKATNTTTYKSTPRSETAAIEKDALGLSLDIFGIDRTEVLESWYPQEKSLGNSFLSGLDQYTAYEDDVISHDMHTLPGWDIISKNITGVVEFGKENGERLTVINANRKPLEKALGVDLIYFHRKYEAFTFVQYKMMDEKSAEDNNIYYNPNQKSHRDELKRMQELYQNICKEAAGNTLNDYRLTNCPIFFKVCKKLELKSDDTSIAKGAYIPLTQWEILLTDTSTKGPKGGRQIGYHTLAKKYISTTIFVELMQKGFLGTQSISSQKIALFVEAAIQNGSSVMYAIEG